MYPRTPRTEVAPKGAFLVAMMSSAGCLLAQSEISTGGSISSPGTSGIFRPLPATQWGAGMWAGLTFLEDCRNTCPAYFRGLHWHNLLKTLTTLCNALEKVDPRIAEIGTRVYERAA